ncbi:MAG: hypothetical protein EOP11_02190 [Proteobacteria bacterium]|nr:MAG: hypothetical protein EOP11_02190 [Pseudomonadota bacterium]
MKLLFTLALLTSAPAMAYQGSISFTEAEKSEHAGRAGIVAEAAANCLTDTYAEHTSFFDKHGVSKFFGNRRYIKGEKPGRRADGRELTPIRPELRKHGIDPNMEKLLTSMSCVDLARRCLGEGFARAGESEFWEKIDAFNKKNGNIGPAVLLGLQALGWKLVYWNPDPSQNAKWDAADRARAPTNPSHVWGHHQARYDSVMGPKRKYYEYYVDDRTTLNGFGKKVPSAFTSAPFFVGFAHTGYHVFVGQKGQVIEAHSVRDLFSQDNVESNPFNPLAGGAPMRTSTEVYLSGLIAVPPGTL